MQLRRLKLLFTPEGRKEWAIDLRHWAKLYPKRAGAVVVAILLGFGWVLDSNLGSMQVIDGSTGKPLEGVYVIAHWVGTPALPLAQSRDNCYRLRVARTDAEGRYILPAWSWTIAALFQVDKGTSTAYYYPGYFEVPGHVDRHGSTAVLWPDPRSVQDRLWMISGTQNSATCMSFENAEQRRALEPVFNAMVEEAIAIGGADAKVASYSNIIWFRDVFVYGSAEKAKRAREVAKSQREKR